VQTLKAQKIIEHRVGPHGLKPGYYITETILQKIKVQPVAARRLHFSGIKNIPRYLFDSWQDQVYAWSGGFQNPQMEKSLDYR